MHLIDEIIEILSGSDPNLSNALTKAQVLAHKFGEASLGAWVKSELVGYSEVSELPTYRHLRLSVYGNISNGYYTYNERRLLTYGIPENLRESLLTKKVIQSIAVIHEWSTKSGVVSPYAPEQYRYFSKGLSKTYQVESAWGAFSEGAFTQILVEVRSRLLDLMLKLADKVPSNPDDPKQVSKDIDVNGIFKGAVFGDGAVVNLAVGSNNTALQNNVQQISKNDLESLKTLLRREKVSDEDLSDLEAAIQGDLNAEDHAKGNFGTGVRTWVGKMISKAGTGAWEVTTKTAASLLTAALNHYYGF